MKLDIELEQFRYDGKKQFELANSQTSIEPLYADKKKYRKLLKQYRSEINELQNTMYAHDRYSALLVFQAMDAAGKDSTIQHVMSGINPHGVKVFAFKRPSSEEPDHTFLWRTNRRMPRRGTINIFNRSYYEEVLVVKVHETIAREHQKLPLQTIEDMDGMWDARYRAIREMERYENSNGTQIAKFFLNVSKDEQKRRFLARIDTPEKNWKFSDADVRERQYWDDYMAAYERAINETASPECPWYVVPADDKKNMRLIVSALVLQLLERLPLAYPKLDKDDAAKLQDCRIQLVNEE